MFACLCVLLDSSLSSVLFALILPLVFHSPTLLCSLLKISLIVYVVILYWFLQAPFKTVILALKIVILRIFLIVWYWFRIASLIYGIPSSINTDLLGFQSRSLFLRLFSRIKVVFGPICVHKYVDWFVWHISLIKYHVPSLYCIPYAILFPYVIILCFMISFLLNNCLLPFDFDSLIKGESLYWFDYDWYPVP